MHVLVVCVIDFLNSSLRVARTRNKILEIAVILNIVAFHEDFCQPKLRQCFSERVAVHMWNCKDHVFMSAFFFQMRTSFCVECQANLKLSKIVKFKKTGIGC